ncbi:hypothetical protein [Cohnella sp. WQ 127256]|uniref:hypothetical protein n=1 Tax=Cohnella sp. WQ 127256 TaxID=2938790 RepID=UPI0021188CD2|nr:hypothetical protein [Cohnella sp. WQ 127256]
MNPTLFSSVKAIINEWDPAQLLTIHCPEDEYHSEIREICRYIEMNDDKNLYSKDMGANLHKIFKDYLGNEFQETEEKSVEISKKIIELIKEKKR